MKDRFLSAVSHELLTPITICRGHLEVLDEAAGDQDLRGIRGMLVEELDIMGRVVEDLTTLARADDAAFLKAESLPLNRFMTCVAAKAGTILPGRVLLQPAAAPGKTLWADPQRLAQALVNLLQNAAGHARGQEPVRLGVRPEPASWRFEVADWGGGRATRRGAGRVRAVHTGGSRASGTGLGLWIVRGSPGPTAGMRRRQPARARRNVLDPDSPMKLLVVEDEARVASFLEKGLRANGYDVEWVSTGRDALRRAAQRGRLAGDPRSRPARPGWARGAREPARGEPRFRSWCSAPGGG